MAMIVNCVILVSVEFAFISSATYSSIIVKDKVGRTGEIEAEKAGIQAGDGHEYGARVDKERSINTSVIPYTEKNSSTAPENNRRRYGSTGDGTKIRSGFKWKHMRDVSNGTTSVDSILTNLEWLEESEKDLDDETGLLALSVKNRQQNKPAIRTRKSTSNKNDVNGYPGNDVKNNNDDETDLLLNDIVKSLASLRDLVYSIKYQNHVIYRQLKRGQGGSCLKSSELQNDNYASNQIDNRRMSTIIETPHTEMRKPSAAAQYSSDRLLNRASEGYSPPPAGATRCPKRFVYNKESETCYQLRSERVTWVTAKERCQMISSNLATVASQRQQKALNDLARANTDTHHCDIWIGLTRRQIGRDVSRQGKPWYWVGSDGTYTNWNKDEPNNGTGNEECVQMMWIFNWRWNDAECNRGDACYVCETAASA